MQQNKNPRSAYRPRNLPTRAQPGQTPAPGINMVVRVDKVLCMVL